MSVCATTEIRALATDRGLPFPERVRLILPADAVALAVVDADAPRAEGFLALAGLETHRVTAWCDSGHRNDPLWRQAVDTGRARGPAYDRPPHPRSGEQWLVHTLPASLDHRRVWLLAIGRTGGDFSDADHTRAALLLRLEQLAFDHCGEPGLGRLLLDSQDRLLHADPRTEARVLADPDAFARFAGDFRQIVAQRWPHGPGYAPHNVILTCNGEPTWVRFSDRASADDLPPNRHIEFRPAQPDDPPPIGLLGDARIAEALGYLSDRYQETPNLRRLAEAAHISPFHFHRLFTREVGVSPKHFLLRTQMMIAKWMLATTREPVNQVAAAAGFSSHGHFTATFHRLVGASPSDYRETHRV